MTTLHGVGVGRGLAVGPVLRMPDPLPEPPTTQSTLGPDAEKERVTHALAATVDDIRGRAAAAGGTAGEVLEAQALMVDDPTLRTDVDARIDSGATAERAVHEAFGVFRDMFAGMGEYMAGRVADLDDISRRAVARISGVAAPGVPESDTPYVLVARDLAPADTALLDAKLVLAIVTAEGGKTSHTAILAGEKGIPAVVGVTGADDIAEGSDGHRRRRLERGRRRPHPGCRGRRRRKVADRAHGCAPRARVRCRTARASRCSPTSDLRRASSRPLPPARKVWGCSAPSFCSSTPTRPRPSKLRRPRTRQCSPGFPGKKVVVRVLDAGADKPLRFLGGAPEENPALGLRGIRSLRASEQILRDQLSALAAAQDAHEAEVWVMAPMVATVEETRYFTSLAKELGLKTAGVMVEVPAAALLADRILRVADFASIGTNDLTQYTMAADRMLGSVGSFHDPWHPAVLKLVAAIGTAGATLGKPVGVCGEAAADPKLAVVLVGLGVTSLSMSAPAIADVRDELARWTPAGARDAAQKALDTEDADAARAVVEALTPA